MAENKKENKEILFPFYEVTTSNTSCYPLHPFEIAAQEPTDRYNFNSYKFNERIIDVIVREDLCLFLTDKGNLFSTRGQQKKRSVSSKYRIGRTDHNNDFGRVQLPAGVRAKSIASGGGHTLVLTDQRTVYCFGNNGAYQLGLGDNLRRITPVLNVHLQKYKITQVEAGRHHSYAITNFGELLGWGANEYGQLGSEDQSNHDVPTVVPLPQGLKVVQFASNGNGEHCLAVLSDGNLYGTGSSKYRQLATLFGYTKIQSMNKISCEGITGEEILEIHAMDNASLVRLRNGDMYYFGAEAVAFGKLAMPFSNVVKVTTSTNDVLVLDGSGIVGRILYAEYPKWSQLPLTAIHPSLTAEQVETLRCDIFPFIILSKKPNVLQQSMRKAGFKDITLYPSS